MKKVEQVAKNNKIVIDYDKTLTNHQIAIKYKQLFENCVVKDKEVIINDSVSLLTKNITYLGHPHPEYKKRIQIPSYYSGKFNENIKKNLHTFFVGIYSYTDEYLYCVFNPQDYLKNKINNSSAHVYSYDLLDARKNGFFRKIDKNQNDIIIFNEKKFVEHINKFRTLEKFLKDIESENDLFKYLDDFWDAIPRIYNGIDCYNEMLAAEYSNALQAEWFGFYFEFLFQKYLLEHQTKAIELYADKTKSGIDLDLKINIYDGYYADLKTHNENGGLLGNDYETVGNIIDNDGTLLYIAIEFSSVPDKEKDGEVTKFWNAQLNEKHNKNKTSDSYLGKMKNEVTAKNIQVLKINQQTFKFVDVFKQGINSDGKARKYKIQISKKNIPLLSIYRRDKK